ncbi:ubiquitin family domain-containing protein [Ditylenchus destructor]|nr:ubiquitin family domain-containing protein [Ditylenchus destructor]
MYYFALYWILPVSIAYISLFCKSACRLSFTTGNVCPCFLITAQTIVPKHKALTAKADFVERGDHIAAYEMARDSFQILVECTDGKTHRLYVHSGMTVFELKKVIRSRTYEHVKNQKLFFNGTDMTSHDSTLSSYRIEHVFGVTHKIQLKIIQATDRIPSQRVEQSENGKSLVNEGTYDTFPIIVENTDGTTQSLYVHSNMTVFELKKIIRSRTRGLVKNQKLFYDGNDMKFHNWTLFLYGITNTPGVTHRIQLKVFHEELIQTLPLKHIHAAIGETYLSKNWHVDLRNVANDKKTRFRGGRAYNRPLGCMRFGIRVLDKYEDSKWIGLKGAYAQPMSKNKKPRNCEILIFVQILSHAREKKQPIPRIARAKLEFLDLPDFDGQSLANQRIVRALPITYLPQNFSERVERVRTNTHGEWPVAYHGTNEQSVLSILEEGFRLDKGTRFLYGKGIYCTPDPLTALAYAFKSVYQGEELQLIIQCRVDPAKLRVVAQPSETGLGEYWTVPSGEDIRPYAVCAYEKKPNPARPLVSIQNIAYQQQNNSTRSNGTAYQSTSSNGNIYSGATRSNTPNPILNSRNSRASQSSYGSSSFNGHYNNSNAYTHSTTTSNQSTSIKPSSSCSNSSPACTIL